MPQNQAVLLIGSVSRKVFALMSFSWFSDRLYEAINSLHIAPSTLPIVLTYNTFLDEHSLNNCCVLGYHGATQSANGTQPADPDLCICGRGRTRTSFLRAGRTYCH